MENMIIAGFRGPYCTYSLPAEQPSAIISIRRAQALCALGDRRISFARITVREKLHSYIKMMKFLKWVAPASHQQIRQALEEVRRSSRIDHLMGIEGAISRKMYDEWASRLPPEFCFRGRNRRPPLDPVNAYISYCNSIIYSSCVNPLAQAGLNTAVGFLHEPGARRHTLALDMAEGLKPILSELSLGLMIKINRFKPEMADSTPSGCYLNKEGRRAAREGMKIAMLHAFGSCGKEFMGWPDSFHKAMQDYAATLTNCVVLGEARPIWKFLK